MRRLYISIIYRMSFYLICRDYIYCFKSKKAQKILEINAPKYIRTYSKVNNFTSSLNALRSSLIRIKQFIKVFKLTKEINTRELYLNFCLYFFILISSE